MSPFPDDPNTSPPSSSLSTSSSSPVPPQASPSTDAKKRTAEEAFGAAHTADDAVRSAKLPNLQRSPSAQLAAVDKGDHSGTGAAKASTSQEAKISPKPSTSGTSNHSKKSTVETPLAGKEVTPKTSASAISTQSKKSTVESKSTPVIAASASTPSCPTAVTTPLSTSLPIVAHRAELLAGICQSKESVASASSSAVTDSEEATNSVDSSDDLEVQFAALGELLDNSAKTCSYSQRYVKRQLIYACRTCTLDVLEPAGMCLACALNCHEEHDVVPLLTRRDFRCDCGNSKFGPRKCKLTADKDRVNPENAYNANFHGKICNCNKDLDSNTSEEVELAQCRLCEEQFHGNHIGVIPDDFGDEWDGELACPKCLNAHPFLKFYAAHLNKPEEAITGESSGCFLVDLEKKHGPQEKAVKGFVFPTKWWEIICKCADCTSMYHSQKVAYLLDPDDTYGAYEEREHAREQENARRASEMSPEEIFAQICEGFDPVTQVELAHWFNNLKEIFVAFLRNKIEQGQTITDADIEEFFEAFNSTQEAEQTDEQS